MAKKRDLIQETPPKRRKLSSEGLVPPSETHILQRSPSPDSGLASWSRSIRGVFSNMAGGDQTNEVINGATPEPSNFLTTASRIYSTVSSQIPRLPENLGLAASIARTKLLNGGMTDDKKYELEAIIQAAVSFPPKSRACQELSGLLIKPLWNDLHHPPLAYLGDEFKYRKSDGSNNNIMYPRMGAAGSPYARSVTPKTLAPSVLPDPGLIFDTIFARGERPNEHPSRISSVLFYLASIITHDIFRTDERDHNKLKNSSYLDLSPLYGSSDDPNSDACAAKVRTFEDGMLKPDTFSEIRVYGLPPGVAVLLICFNRFHNYVASQLKEINEGGRFTPSQRLSDEDARKKVDEDLFQTARLITCGLYVNIILHDYVRTILNLQTVDTPWTLDPRSDCDNIFDEHGVPSGIGNQVSVEFNLVYRWHSTISERDAEWIEKKYGEIFKGDDKECDDIYSVLNDPKDYFNKIKDWHASIKACNPEERKITGLERNNQGKFDDERLVTILTESTEDIAGAFGPKNVPQVMRLIEIMGIEQARGWHVCTLNEFRKFFQLEPHRTFSDITKNQDVARTLETLYSKPDYVELYPGLVAEDAKEAIEPGSGLCPGFTTSRAILADAVALVRGDRFYTVDYTPAILTNWGWNLVKSDPEVAGGGVIHNLIMRALPSYYRGNSVYAMFPLVHPDRTKEILTKLGKVDEYDFSLPKVKHHPLSIKSYRAVKDILGNQNLFKVPWGPHTEYLTGHDYMLSGDKPSNKEQHKKIGKALYPPCSWKKQIREYYYKTTYQLIKDQSDELKSNTYQLDVVKDVANPSHTLFVAQMFHIPIKGDGNIVLATTTKDLYLGLAVLFAYVFLDGDTAKSFKLRASAKAATDKLKKLVGSIVHLVSISRHSRLNELFGWGSSGRLLADYGTHMIERLFEVGKSEEEIVAEILPTAAASVATQAQAMAQMIDVYLEDEYKHHWPEIRRCAYSDEEEDFETLKKYALEGCRLAPAAFGLLRLTQEDGKIEDGEGKPVEYHRGDLLYTDFVAAGRDSNVFPNPDMIDVHRDSNLYIHQGMGPHSCLGRDITEISLAVQLGLFARLKNLRRMPGQAGKLKYTTNLPGGNPGAIRVYMTEDWNSWFPFPTTMKVEHDGICRTLAEHETQGENRTRSDSGVGMGSRPGILVNGSSS